MSDQNLDRLRAINPVTGAVTPPSIELVRARMAAAPERRTRLAGWLVPTVGVAVALAVAAVIVVALGHRSAPSHPAGSPRPTPAPAAPPHVSRIPPLPRGGMAGNVQLWGAAAASAGGSAVVSFEQCHPCERTQSFAEWMARSSDHGAHWTVMREPFYLLTAGFDSASGVWGDGQSRYGTAINEVVVSHDGGRRWTQASTPAGANEPGTASVAGGEAWASFSQCGRAGCTTTIERGPAGGTRLAPTVAQPATGPGQVQIVAVGPRSAAVAVISSADPRHLGLPRLLITRDDGRRWQASTNPCPFHTADVTLAASRSGTLWESCANGRGRTLVAVSIDDGRVWRTSAVTVPLHNLEPTGPASAWAVSDRDGAIVRTTDAGRTWSPVLRPRGGSALLAASARLAIVVEVAGHGELTPHPSDANLVAFRTSDGGATWRAVVIALPRG